MKSPSLGVSQALLGSAPNSTSNSGQGNAASLRKLSGKFPYLKSEDGDSDFECIHTFNRCVLRTHYKPGTGHQWLPGQTHLEGEAHSRDIGNQQL